MISTVLWIPSYLFRKNFLKSLSTFLTFKKCKIDLASEVSNHWRPCSASLLKKMNVSKIRILAHCATLWFFVNVASRDCNFKRRRWFYKFKMVASALRRMLLFCYCLILQQPWWLLWRKQCCLPFRAGMTTRSWDNHKTMTSAKFLGLLLIVGGIQFASAIRFVQQGKNLHSQYRILRYHQL